MIFYWTVMISILKVFFMWLHLNAEVGYSCVCAWACVGFSKRGQFPNLFSYLNVISTRLPVFCLRIKNYTSRSLYICAKHLNFLIFVGNIVKHGQVKNFSRPAHRDCHVMRWKTDSTIVSVFLTVMQSNFLAVILLTPYTIS